MKRIIKRLLILILCVSLLGGDCAVKAFAMENDNVVVDVDEETVIVEEADEGSEEESEEKVAEEVSEESADENEEQENADEAEENANEQETLEETTEESLVEDEEATEEIEEETEVIGEILSEDELKVLANSFTANITLNNDNGNLSHLKNLYTREYKEDDSIYEMNVAKQKVTFDGGITAGAKAIITGKRIITLAHDVDADPGYSIVIKQSDGSELPMLGSGNNADSGWFHADGAIDMYPRYFAYGEAGCNVELELSVVEVTGYHIRVEDQDGDLLDGRVLGSMYGLFGSEPCTVGFNERYGGIEAVYLTDEYGSINVDITDKMVSAGEGYKTIELTLADMKENNLKGINAIIKVVYDIALDKPQNLKASLTAGEIKVTWDKVEDADEYYLVIADDDPYSMPYLIETISGKTEYITKNVNWLFPDKKYVISVSPKKDGVFSKAAKCDLLITEAMLKAVPISNISTNWGNEVYLREDDAFTKLDILLEPSAAYYWIQKEKPVFKSSNEEVCTIDEYGNITVEGVGYSTITVSIHGKTKNVGVTIYGALESAELSGEDEEVLLVGQVKSYSTTFVPRNCYVSLDGEEWNNSDESVANVSGYISGFNVVAKKAGTTTITGTFNGTIDLKKKITVKDSIDVYLCNNEVETISGVSAWDDYSLHLSKIDENKINIPGKIFIGWYRAPGGKGERISQWDSIVDGNPVYGYWIDQTEEFVVAPIGDIRYSGEALRPELKVYDGNYEMVEGVDYRVTYTRNINAGTANAIVQGIGRYSSRVIKTFNITPRDLNDGLANSIQMTVAYNGRVQKPLPQIYYSNKLLRNNVDYTLAYSDVNGYKVPGVYYVTATGKGNYTGTFRTEMVITNNRPIDKVRAVVEKDNGKDWKYTGNPIKPPVKVTDGRKILEEGKDYTVQYPEDDCSSVGEKTIYIYGNGEYSGTKAVKYKIVGEPIARTVVKGIEPVTYYHDEENGVTLPNLKIYPDARSTEPLTEGTDYLIYYDYNFSAGRARVYIEGIGKYTGTTSRVFVIKPAPVKLEDVVINENAELSAPFAKGMPVNPIQSVTLNGVDLYQGTDYNLRFINYSKVAGKDDIKAPTVILTFIRNYSGSYKIPYEIKEAGHEAVRIETNDVVFANRKSNWRSAVAVYDGLSGRKMALRTDYDLSYEYKSGEEWTEAKLTDSLPIGTQLRAVVALKGNYTQHVLYSEYQIITKSITGASVRVEKQYFSNKTFELKEEDILVKVGRETLKLGEDYVITGYDNAFNFGPVKVYLQGIGEYGGRKTITIRILPKAVK